MKINEVAFGSRSFVACIALLATLGLGGHSLPARGEEPAARFLERLKDEGLYDQAIKYLEIGIKRNRLPEAMKSELELERILLLQLSLKDVRNDKEMNEKLAAIEKGFKDFLAGKPEHPRRGETMLKLADMYLARGGEILDSAKAEASAEGGAAKAIELRDKARSDLNQAYALFGETTAYLKPILESMRGASIKPNETEKIAYREFRTRTYVF